MTLEASNNQGSLGSNQFSFIKNKTAMCSGNSAADYHIHQVAYPVSKKLCCFASFVNFFSFPMGANKESSAVSGSELVPLSFTYVDVVVLTLFAPEMSDCNNSMEENQSLITPTLLILFLFRPTWLPDLTKLSFENKIL